MKPITSIISSLIFFTCILPSFAGATTYSTVASGNYNSPAVWSGGNIPPAVLSNDTIRITSGNTITLNDNIVLNNDTSLLQIMGNLTSTSANYISVNRGTLSGGGGSINIDSMYLGSNALLRYYTLLTVNKMELAATTLNYNLYIIIKKEIRLSSGFMRFYQGNIELKANADIVYGGGSLGLGGGKFDLTSGYNVRYFTKSYQKNLLLDTNYIREIEIAVGNGNSVTLLQDITIKSKLKLTSGTFNIASYRLTFDEQSEMASTGTGTFSALTGGSIVINSKLPSFGTMRFSSPISYFTANNNTIVRLGSDLSISQIMHLDASRIHSNGHTVTLQKGARYTQGAGNGYIITNISGSLKQYIHGNDSAYYRIGTFTGPTPVVITNNTGTDYTDFNISVSDTVLENGTTGKDITTYTSVVKAAYHTSCSNSNLDFNIATSWQTAHETNGFKSDACFMTHYNNNSWGNQPHAGAIVTPDYKTLTRSNITATGVFAIFDTATTVSIIDRNHISQNISLYPNPAYDKLMLNASVVVMKIEVFGLTGNKLVAQNGNGTKAAVIDVSSLPSGMYVLKVNDVHHTSFIKR